MEVMYNIVNNGTMWIDSNCHHKFQKLFKITSVALQSSIN
jgi:hypothetical protein